MAVIYYADDEQALRDELLACYAPPPAPEAEAC